MERLGRIDKQRENLENKSEGGFTEALRELLLKVRPAHRGALKFRLYQTTCEAHKDFPCP